MYIQFAVIGCIFAALMGYSMWNCISFFNKLDFLLHLFRNVAYRPPYASALLAVLRMEIGDGKLLSYGNVTNLYDFFRVKFNQNEEPLMIAVQSLRSKFPNLFNNWTKLDSKAGCTDLYFNNSYRTPQRI